MRINSFDDSDASGFDPRNYAPIGLSGKITIATSMVYTSLLNIAGEGFINIVSVAGAGAYVRITIDGTQYLFYGSSFPGFCTDSEVVDAVQASYKARVKTWDYTSSTIAFREPGKILDFKKEITDYNGGVATSEIPIFFNNSCIIATTSANAASDVGYFIRGGLLT